MKGICIVSSSIASAQNGAGKRAERCAEYLHARGRLSAVITTESSKNNVDKLNIPSDIFHTLKSEYNGKNREEGHYLSNIPKLLASLVRIQMSILWTVWVNRKSIDALHVFETSGWLSLMALSSAKVLNINTVAEVALLGKDDPKSLVANDSFRVRGLIKMKLATTAKKYVSRSPAIRRALLKEGVRKSEIFKSYNPINTDKYVPIGRKEKRRLKKRHNLENRKVIIYVGKIWKRKGTALLLKTFSLVKGEHNAHLLVAGEPPQNKNGKKYMQKVKNIYHRYDLEKRVEFLGYKSDVVKYLQMSDVFILPSSREGLSNAMLEAMSCGLPIVAKDDDSVHGGIVVDKKHGLLVQKRTAENFSSVLVELMRNSRLRKKMSDKCRKFAENNLETSLVMDEYISLYNSI